MPYLRDIDAYLNLLSVEPKQNRYRFYRIRIRTVNILASFYLITFSWGRLHQSSKHKVVSCATETELNGVLKLVLKTRLRHHYQILECSPDFPVVAVMEKMGYSSLPNQQLTLF